MDVISTHVLTFWRNITWRTKRRHLGEERGGRKEVEERGGGEG